jgi:hypothetical protein
MSFSRVEKSELAAPKKVRRFLEHRVLACSGATTAAM